MKATIKFSGEGQNFTSTVEGHSPIDVLAKIEAEINRHLCPLNGNIDMSLDDAFDVQDFIDSAQSKTKYVRTDFSTPEENYEISFE
jgi:hypothetical protein